MIYKAEYIDGDFEIFGFCDNDSDAMDEALIQEDKHELLCSLFEVDEDYNEIREVY